MLSTALSPVDRTAEVSLEEVAEALALTYLAYYNTGPLEPRVNTAFLRAFGLKTLNLHARAIPTPGYVVSTAELSHRNTMTIAIEGTTDLSQIDPILQYTLNTRLGGVTQWVYSVFNTYATTIWNAIHANNTYAAAIASGTYIFTFTGHSLGAAIADVLSYKWKVAYPNKPVRLIKFGSPRVGGGGWVNRTDNVVNQRWNIYTADDPIHQFPSALTFALGMSNVAGTVCRLNAVSETFGSNLQRNGSAFPCSAYSNPISSGHFIDVASLARTLDADNPWYWHMMKSYRLAFMNLFNRREDLLRYRFNFLEFPDENSWQVRYSPAAPSWATMDAIPQILPVQPDPVNPNPVILAADAQAGAVGGGDWGEPATVAVERPRMIPSMAVPLPPPIQTQSLGQRRVPRRS